MKCQQRKMYCYQSLRWNTKFVTKYYESKYDVYKTRENLYMCCCFCFKFSNDLQCKKSVIQIRFFLICFLTKYNNAWKVSKYGDFLVRIFLYSDQKKLRIWTLFTQCMSYVVLKNDCNKYIGFLALQRTLELKEKTNSIKNPKLR